MTDIEKHSNKRIKRRETPRERNTETDKQGQREKQTKTRLYTNPPHSAFANYLKIAVLSGRTHTYLQKKKYNIIGATAVRSTYAVWHSGVNLV